MKLLVIADPLATFKTYKDSTFAMMREASRRGHALFAMEAREMIVRGGVVSGYAATVSLKPAGADPCDWFEVSAQAFMPLSDFDIVLMRKDPPVDTDYLHDTLLLGTAQRAGARVVNDPRGLRDLNEKLSNLTEHNAIFNVSYT